MYIVWPILTDEGILCVMAAAVAVDNAEGACRAAVHDGRRLIAPKTRTHTQTNERSPSPAGYISIQQ